MKTRTKFLIGSIAAVFIFAVCAYRTPANPDPAYAIGFSIGYLILSPVIYGTAFWLLGMAIVMPVRWLLKR